MFVLFQKSVLRVLFFSSVLLSLFSCQFGKGLSGVIIHDQLASHTYKGEFVFTSESYALVTLNRKAEGEFSPSRVIAKQKIENIDSFPIPFSLSWKEDLDFSDTYTYHLMAKVFQKKGEEMREGDLLTETVTEWRPGQRSVILRAVGVELCSSEGSGGFCLGD